MAMCSSGKLIGQKWEMAVVPYPSRSSSFTGVSTLLSVKDDSSHSFHVVQSSDLLIHESGSQFWLFDPRTKKDVLLPFPSKPADRYWFNRSRTACLVLQGDQVVIIDTLSAQSGEPKILSRPPWGRDLQRLISYQYSTNGFHHPVILTEDASKLLLIPYWKNTGVGTPNFTGEIWNTNSTKDKFTIPTELKEGNLLDAELIDGEILLMWRNYLSKEGVDGVKLLNTRGEILYSGIISATTHGNLWNIKRHQMLFPHWTGSGSDGELWSIYYLWDYKSNSARKINL